MNKKKRNCRSEVILDLVDLEILYELLRRGKKDNINTLGVISKKINLSQNSTCLHLKRLRSLNLIHSTRIKKYILYFINPHGHFVWRILSFKLEENKR